jgi:hypothetical protein
VVVDRDRTGLNVGRFSKLAKVDHLPNYDLRTLIVTPQRKLYLIGGMLQDGSWKATDSVSELLIDWFKTKDN